MAFARMMASHKDAVICDFAQYYHVLDIRSLNLELAAILACGLPADSRTIKEMQGRDVSNDEYYHIAILDAITIMNYTYRSTHSKHSISKPELMMDRIRKKQTSDVMSYSSAEEFEAAVKEIKEN